MLDYNAVQSLTEDEFRAKVSDRGDLENTDLFTKATPEELRFIERILDVQPDTLHGQDYYLQRAECRGCGEILRFADFVLTGLLDAGHPKSFTLHTFLGVKFVVNAPRAVRCFKCGNNDTQLTLGYGCNGVYGCPRPPG